MPKGFLPSFVKCSLSLGLLCLLLWPARAFGNPADMVTLQFTGGATCTPTAPGVPCLSSGATITGVLSFDPDTGTMGAWSFSTPFGPFSSTELGASSVVFEYGNVDSAHGNDSFFFYDAFGNQMYLDFAGGRFGGTLFMGYLTGNDFFPYVFTSGYATLIAGATPEPSSLLLLGTGLLGLLAAPRLGPFLRRFAHS